MLRRLTLTLALTIAVGAAASCSSGSSTASTASSSAPSSSAGSAITIKDFVFSPTPLNAKVGDTITVSNQDGTDHELKANDASFDTGRFSSGSKTIKVEKAGMFAYHCAIHDYMTGVIQVSAS